MGGEVGGLRQGAPNSEPESPSITVSLPSTPVVLSALHSPQPGHCLYFLLIFIFKENPFA